MVIFHSGNPTKIWQRSVRNFRICPSGVCSIILCLLPVFRIPLHSSCFFAISGVVVRVLFFPSYSVTSPPDHYGGSTWSNLKLVDQIQGGKVSSEVFEYSFQLSDISHVGNFVFPAAISYTGWVGTKSTSTSYHNPVCG